MKDLKPQYNNYIKTVSKNAVSYQYISTAIQLCCPYYRVVDLGSGFTSFVLRAYRKELNLDICSVDTSRAWLEKTKEFCAQNDVDTDGFMLWSDLIVAPRQFD